MTINPKTYEGVAMSLADAGSQVTDDVAKSLTELHKALIKDPDNLSRAANIYTKRVAQASREWEKNWRTWADEDLVNSYLQGFQHTELELERLRRAGMDVPPPAQSIPEGSPLAGKTPAGKKDIPLGVRKAFQGIPNHLTAYNVFRQAAHHHLEGTALQIVRASNDLYRDIAVQAMEKNFKETDIFTRRKLSQDMLNDFAQKGLQSITYSNGRKVSIEAYSEMLGRTMSGHAAVQASLNRYAEHGYDLVRVSAHFRACGLCVPWEGRVLSQSGQEPGYPSLDEAISAGLFHPNCAHDISAYIPGLSPEELDVRVSPSEQKLIDQHGYQKAQEIAYKAQAQQRYMERQIRSWKRREMTALDSATKAKAHRKVLDWQKAQRNHLAKNSFLSRKYEREAVKGWAMPRAGTAQPAPKAPDIPVRAEVRDLLYDYRAMDALGSSYDILEEELINFTAGGSGYSETSTDILKGLSVAEEPQKHVAVAQKLLQLVDEAPRYPGTLYRLEEVGANPDLALRVGHEFKLGLRSFSRSAQWIKDTLEEGDIDFDTPIVLRLKNAKSINVTPYSPYFREQMESVTAGTFRVLQVSDSVFGGEPVKLVVIEQLKVL